MKRITVQKNRNFTTINNEFIFKKEMSLKAKGLLCHLLALPDDWELYVEEVVNWHKDGRGAIYSAFKELSQLGYIEREVKRKKGKIISHEYIVYEVPKHLHVEKPLVENQHVENKTLLNTDKTNNLCNQDYLIKWKEISNELNFSDIDNFIDYWTEKTPGAKKCRWQKQNSFDVKRRMQRWMRNNKQPKNMSSVHKQLDNWQQARKLINE